jgi:hypothetical protein
VNAAANAYLDLPPFLPPTLAIRLMPCALWTGFDVLYKPTLVFYFLYLVSRSFETIAISSFMRALFLLSLVLSAELSADSSSPPFGLRIFSP